MHETWSAQFRRGIAELTLLGVLRDQESYGYEIVGILRGITALSLSPATIYPVLARLEDAGYLDVREKASPQGPPRRYYKLSRAGRERLALLSGYWSGASAAVDAILHGKIPSNQERKGE